jgi:hypothetical protein
MRESHVDRVSRQLLGKLAIVEPVLAVLAFAPPGTQMHLVDRHGCIE